MKKRNSSQQSQKRTVKAKRTQESVTIGMDLGDRSSRYCMLSGDGEILREDQVPTTKAGMTEALGALGRSRIAIEVGSHSPWVSRLLSSLGHEVVVANPRQVKLITESTRKDDRLDAQTLARLARIDPHPTSKRGGTNGVDGHPGTGGADWSAYQFGEHRPRFGESDGRAIAKM